jgi:hypothetical protein
MRKLNKKPKHEAAAPPPRPDPPDPHNVIVTHWMTNTGKDKRWVTEKLIEIGHMTLKHMTGGVNDARREIDALSEAVAAKIAAEQEAS